MKKQFFFMFSALAVALPLSLSLQSCGDDDDDDPQVNNTELLGGNTGNNGTDGGNTGDGDEVTVSTDVAVDLGLSVRWASYNVGASSPEEYGDYYAWGETESKEDYSWHTYLTLLGGTMSSYNDCGTSNDPLRFYVYSGNYYKVASKAGDADGIGGTEYDVARVKLGEEWRMPTQKEQKELRDKCNWRWTTYKGVNGYLVKSNTTGNSIFLPAAGYRYGTYLGYAGEYGDYWSSTPHDNSMGGAYNMNLGSSEFQWSHSGNRCGGRSVRPVCPVTE